MTDLLDRLHQNIDNIKNFCPSIITLSNYDTTLGKATIPGIELSSEIATDDEITELQAKYFAVVEEGNGYLAKLRDAEEAFFKKKYGEKIYNYLNNQRGLDTSSSSTTSIPGSNSSSDYSTLKQALKDEYEIYNRLKQITDSIQDSYNIGDDVNQNLDINNRKMIYRNEITNDVMKKSNYATYIYYFIVISFIMFLYANDGLKINDNKVLYATIIVFPFIYRILFNTILWAYNQIYISMKTKGPKNAFLNDKEQEPFFLEDQED